MNRPPLTRETLGKPVFIPIDIPYAARVRSPEGMEIPLRAVQHLTPGFYALQRDETGARLELILGFNYPIRS